MSGSPAHLKALKPTEPFVFRHPIISAELATPEPAMALIKEECVGLAGNKLKGKKRGVRVGGWRRRDKCGEGGLILNTSNEALVIFHFA